MNVETLWRQYVRGDRDFSNAELSFANLTRAKLSGINLIWANLSHALLSRNLSGANELTGCKFGRRKFSSCQLNWRELRTSQFE